MSEQVQKGRERRDTAPPEEAEHTNTSGASKDVLDDVDELLDEIDDVLEENAEEFIRGYVQKGGQ